MSDLARRAVACSGWRWMPGMLTLPTYVGWGAAPDTDGVAACRQQDDGCWLAASTADVSESYDACPVDPIPDLDDPATLGCLLALVREARRDPHAMVWPPGWAYSRWRVVSGGWLPAHGDTEAEALVAALEVTNG